MSNKKLIKRTYNVVIIAALVAFIVLVCSRFVHWGNVEYTDDAQVWRHITPVNARVGGFIKEIRFDDYQRVNKGDTLVIIEDAELRLALAQAEAGLRGQQSGSHAVTAGMTTTASNVRAAQAGIDHGQKRGGHVRVAYAPFVDGGREADKVGGDPAADGDHQRVAVGPMLKQPAADFYGRFRSLGGLAGVEREGGVIAQQAGEGFDGAVAHHEYLRIRIQSRA